MIFLLLGFLLGGRLVFSWGFLHRKVFSDPFFVVVVEAGECVFSVAVGC